MIINSDMPCQRRVIRHDGMVANDAIMGDMHIGHNPVMAADFGRAFVLNRATIKGTKLTDDIVITDFKQRRLILEFLSCGFAPSDEN